MNQKHTCPFCNVTMAVSKDTHLRSVSSFSGINGAFFASSYESDSIALHFYKCPNCSKISIYLEGIGEETKEIFIPVKPMSLAKQFPDYIPPTILEDYNEAYAILYLSPKASATLSRRCLQGMIRDFWGIAKSRLIDEINALQSKVSPSQWKVIDSIRSIGNIGAHMEKDVNTIIDIEPDEAEKLLKLIELLLAKWYIARHDEEELFTSITSIADSKKN